MTGAVQKAHRVPPLWARRTVLPRSPNVTVFAEMAAIAIPDDLPPIRHRA